MNGNPYPMTFFRRMTRYRPKIFRAPLRWIAWGLILLLSGISSTALADIETTVQALAASPDRSTGTPGCRAAADYIHSQLSALGLQPRRQQFAVPVRRHIESRLALPEKGRAFPIHPLPANAISPGTIPAGGLEGPVIYAGSGELAAFDHQKVDGAVVLMEMTSGKNWQNAAGLGARALIYVDRGETGKQLFEEKLELSPIRFPRFWLPLEAAREIFGDFTTWRAGRTGPRARLTSAIRWEEAEAENIYALIPGSDPELADELLVLEAFYDSTARVAGRAPGAEQALGAATLLEAARHLRDHPPRRPVLLAATSGHGQTLAGMREFVYALHEDTEALEEIREELAAAAAAGKQAFFALKAASFDRSGLVLPPDKETRGAFREALGEEIKTEVDRISRELMRLRLQEKGAAIEVSIQALAKKRFLLRRLGWRKDYRTLAADEQAALREFLPRAVSAQKRRWRDAAAQLSRHESSMALRALVADREIAAAVSLHLSSHGSGLGAFHQGFLYPLEADINRTAAYVRIDEVLRRSAAAGGFPLRDTLRPSLTRSFESHFRDRPFLGGEVSALAGFPGFSLVTVEDARPLWGTPSDTPDAIDWDQAHRQNRLACRLVAALAAAPRLNTGSSIRDGFCVLTGRANFLRHGELFADQPAPGTTMLAFQGPARYHARVDTRGVFRLKGVADKRHVLHKVILEGYRFDPESGETVWAIDKETTGKDAYRVKMRRAHMETDLVMFACRQTTLFGLLEPRNFNYLTRLELIDARRETQPAHYWYSRIDTRASVIASVYLEPGTHLKLTLSDSILNKKMILTHATPGHPTGTGYLVDAWPMIHHTGLMAARDMWRLLDPRIRNLESHGIHNQLIRDLQKEGTGALAEAQQALAEREYDRCSAASLRSWALAARVYSHVEKTQQDVLFGVLFYIALFVPFAFCMERFLFSHTDIHRRILAFGGILMAVILLIRAVHPAFALAYSPTVVILAFFIMGLSFLVSLIIFSRFEREMALLQHRASHLNANEIGRWKAFMAAFFLGVGNLRRRRLRTILTCLTLIILTFTIMGFTAVKTVRDYTRVYYQEDTPYQGFLLKNGGWRDLPREAAAMVQSAFEGGVAAPRAWMETEDRTRPVQVPVAYQGKTARAEGLIGLSPQEPEVTGIGRVLTAGGWFQDNHSQSVLLPGRMAASLGIDPGNFQGAAVRLWGTDFQVAGIFDSDKLQAFLDLDGEPLTSVTFPSEASVAMSEVEMEALESGEDVAVFQSRYQHVRSDMTLIVPCGTLLAAGGNLKSVAVRPPGDTPVASLARTLVDRFGLLLFAGEARGTFLYNAGDTLDYSGVPNILIPMAIAVFIVLNTMIGSVYERRREIGIYTSVGLAPSHVGFLFIAEALALGVISVVFGYLLAQSSAALLAGTRLWAGITVNYSSLSGVATMLLVLLVVLVSAIYPARVAAAIAIPDVRRVFVLPQARGGALELTLPVLLRYREAEGVGGFIHAYFRGHQDVSHGLFAAGDLRLNYICNTLNGRSAGVCTSRSAKCPHGVCLHLCARVWLAPFDFGIMQKVDVTFCPHPIDPEFLEIKVRIEREAGEVNPWRRINQAFVHQLRKQLLLWRSLDEKNQMDCRRELKDLAGDCPPGRENPAAGGAARTVLYRGAGNGESGSGA